MRAMIRGEEMDFVFSKIEGGANFMANGMKQDKLVGPWVWKGALVGDSKSPLTVSLPNSLPRMYEFDGTRDEIGIAQPRRTR